MEKIHVPYWGGRAGEAYVFRPDAAGQEPAPRKKGG